MAALTPEGLTLLLIEILEGYDTLDAPYRPVPEGRVMRPTPGPTAPVSASVVEARMNTERTLRAIVGDYTQTLGVAGPTSRTVPALCAWLGTNRTRLVGALHEGDVLDLEIIRDNLVRLTGIHDDDATNAVALAEARRMAMPGASHFGTSREIARLATAAGRPTSHITVQRWARAGHVDTRGDLYSLDDVLIYHDARNQETAAA